MTFVCVYTKWNFMKSSFYRFVKVKNSHFGFQSSFMSWVSYQQAGASQVEIIQEMNEWSWWDYFKMEEFCAQKISQFARC